MEKDSQNENKNPHGNNPREYHSIKDFESEIVISRSRFITKVFHIKSEDEATEKLRELKKKYSDASHICYGFVADKAGNTVRFSDAGEPSGTAGAPIIDAVLKQGLRQILVAVVRYFGGIKLGGGGLTRAYGGCAADAISSAERIRFVLSDVLEIDCDFAATERLKRCLSAHGKILKTDYAGFVTITAALPVGEDIAQEIADISCGKAAIRVSGTEYVVY